jgi:hypothetical protein
MLVLEIAGGVLLALIVLRLIAAKIEGDAYRFWNEPID